MSTDELKTFQKCYSDLNLAIRSDVIPLAEKLFSVGLITSENLNVLSNTNTSEVERASKLLSLVFDKVKLNARNYHVFVKVLISERDTYKEVLKNLEPIYKEPSDENEQPATSVSANVHLFLFSVSANVNSSTLPAANEDEDTRITETAPVCSLEFSDDLSPSKVANWLNQELEKKYLSLEPHMREKLIEDHINGAAFKGLTENDLKAMEFKLGFRKNILAIISEIAKPEDVTEGVDSNKSPKMTCTLSLIPRLVDEPAPYESLCEGGAPASMPFDGRLWRKEKLIVQIFASDYFSHWNITEKEFFGCVYRWCGDDIGGETSYIPKFELGYSNPDIIVYFNENGWNQCTIGHNIDEYPSKLYLDLSHNDQAYREHLIVHEFGHALGLGHEHQRSDFWDCITHFVNKNLMKRDLGGRFVDWEVDESVHRGGASQDYDPDSAMHYWFDKSWLTNGFSDENKVEEDAKKKLYQPQVISALRGVHKRHICHVTIPSYEDLKFLNEKYKCIRQSGGKSNGDAPTQGTPNGANTEGHHPSGGAPLTLTQGTSNGANTEVVQPGEVGPPNPSVAENVHQSGGPPPIDKPVGAVGQKERRNKLILYMVMMVMVALVSVYMAVGITSKDVKAIPGATCHKMVDDDSPILAKIIEKYYGNANDWCKYLHLTTCDHSEENQMLANFDVSTAYLRTRNPCWEDIVRVLCKNLEAEGPAKDLAKKHNVDFDSLC